MDSPRHEAASVVLATAGYDNTIRFWDVVNGDCVKIIQHRESHINCLALTEDKRHLGAGGLLSTRLYDVAHGGAPLQTFEGHKGNVIRVGFNANPGTPATPASRWMFTGSDDGTIKIWDMRATRCQRDFVNKIPLTDVCLHPNQEELISCDAQGSVRIWDLAGNACSCELIPEEDVPIKSIAVSNDGTRLIAGNCKGRVFAWQIPTVASESPEYEPVACTNAHSTYITKVCMSPDDTVLATASADHTVRLWDASFGNTEAASEDDEEEDERGSASAWRQSPFSRTVSPSTNHSPLETLKGHQRWVWDCAFSADSAYLVSASSDGTARLWDLRSGETICIYAGHEKAVTAVALNDCAS